MLRLALEVADRILPALPAPVAYALADAAGDLWHRLAPARRRLVAANLGSTQGQCYVPLALPNASERRWRLRDLLSQAEYVRDGDDLSARGLYLDMPPHACHLFDVEPL